MNEFPSEDLIARVFHTACKLLHRDSFKAWTEHRMNTAAYNGPRLITGMIICHLYENISQKIIGQMVNLQKPEQFGNVMREVLTDLPAWFSLDYVNACLHEIGMPSTTIAALKRTRSKTKKQFNVLEPPKKFEPLDALLRVQQMPVIRATTEDVEAAIINAPHEIKITTVVSGVKPVQEKYVGRTGMFQKPELASPDKE